MARLLCVVALVCAAPAGAATTKNVTGWITALAMDGPQVAYATEAFAPTNCFKLFTWDVATGGGVLVSGPRNGPCASDEPHGQRITSVAIAGSRVAWIRTISGNTESDETLYAASLPKPREAELATAVHTGDAGSEALKGTWIGGLVGSGDALAVNTWTTESGGVIIKASLQSIRPTRLAQLAWTPGFIYKAEAADAGRVGVLRPDSTVEILSAVQPSSGSTIRPSSVREVALRKDYLVVLTKTNTLEIYNSRTGAFIRKWPVPAGAAHLDVHSDIAVFSVWRTLYGLQLTSGKQAVLAKQKRAIVAADIEAPGVVYAYNSVRGIADIGNLVFLPLADVKKAVS